MNKAEEKIFMQGYLSAVANLIYMFGVSVQAESLFLEVSDSLKSISQYDIDKHDMELISKLFK